MKVFSLSLERAVQCRDFMSKQLNRLKLNHEFIQGTEYRYICRDDFCSCCAERMLYKKVPSHWLIFQCVGLLPIAAILIV